MAPEIGISNTIPFQMNVRAINSGGSTFEYTPIDNSFSMLFDQAAGTTYNAGNLIALEWNKAFSNCAWIKVGSSITAYISGKQDPTVNNGKGWSFSTVSSSLNVPKRLKVQIARTLAGPVALRNSIEISTTANEVPFDTWAHVAFTYDGSKNSSGLKLYVNGSEITNITDNSLNPPLTNDVDTTVDAGIGGLNATNTTSTFNGYIDEIAFWNAIELSPETIKAIYDTTVNNPGKVADLSETPEGLPAAWYRMGD